MDTKEEYLEKLSYAVGEFRVAMEVMLEWAKAKQKQRAEPWQQNVIDSCEMAIKKYTKIMKGDL